jgi:hypothetical protein
MIVDTVGMDDARYRKAVRYWLADLADAIAGDVLDRHGAGDETVTANMYVVWAADDEADQVAFDSARITQVVDELVSRGRPELILVAAEEESDNGFRVPGAPGESFLASLRVRTSSDLPGVVTFQATGTYWSADDRLPVVVQDRWVSAGMDFCDHLPVTFGSVSTDDGVGLTALDMALGRSEQDSVRESAAVLRGYSWVTICPPPIVDRLGGVAKLEESGAFWRLRPLASGAAWMQATERFEDYRDAAIERVFRVLAPVLPGGLVKPTWGNSWPTLVHADASQHRD